MGEKVNSSIMRCIGKPFQQVELQALSVNSVPVSKYNAPALIPIPFKKVFPKNHPPVWK